MKNHVPVESNTIPVLIDEIVRRYVGKQKVLNVVSTRCPVQFLVN